MNIYSTSSKRLELAVEAYNKVSKVKLPNAEAFQRMLSVSPKLRKWYEDWSFTYSSFSQMPQSYIDAGISREEWTRIQGVLPEINKVRKVASEEIAKKSAEFSAYVDAKEAEVNAKLAKLEEPLIKILKVNVLCLDFDTQFEILSKPEEEREAFQKQKLEELRTKLLKDLANGEFQDPFHFGDFQELLL